MIVNMVGAFKRNAPFGTEIAFSKGMQRIGHTVNEIDPDYPHQWVQDADATLVFKWIESEELRRQLDRCSGPKILYQPDDARFTHIREMVAKMRDHCDLFLAFDGHSTEVARTFRYRDAETLLLTADDELYCPSPEPIERDIDVSFVGSLTRGANHASRMRMCMAVQEEADRRGWTTWFGEAYFRPGEVTPVDIYRRSKVVLNHATDVGQEFGWGYGLQCRHFEVGMTRTALLTNEAFGHTELSDDVGIFSDEASLIHGLDTMLSSRSTWEGAGRRLYDAIVRAHLPQHRAQQLTRFIERNS